MIHLYFISVHHSGDLIALGPTKPSSSKSSLRHPGSSDSDDLSKPSKSSTTLASGGNPPKKFKAAITGDNSGGLFSDPIRVSQVSQAAGSAGKPSSSVKGSHGVSPQPGAGTATAQQIIEGT